MNVRWMRLRLPCVVIKTLFVALALSTVMSPATACGQALAATYTRNVLHLLIPYHASRAGSGQLVVELLDPEDKVIAHGERAARTADGNGKWGMELAIAKSVPFDDLVWERVRYRFEYADEKTPAFEQIRSVSEILRRPVVHVLGQSAYLAGGQAAIRILVSDSENHPISGNSSVRIELLVPGQATLNLFEGPVNRRGTVEPAFRFPARLIGNYQLHFVAETPIGTSEYTGPVTLEDKVSILLTTEKPIYQPGQTLHVRALALDRADHHAATGPLTFEMEDSRGNKVFKKATETDTFGIASAEFILADEVNLGTYHLRALMGDPAAPANSAELALNVERYVLPKFKVSVEFAQKDGKPRRDYRPAEHVTGTVHANYFFGKPVEDAEVTVKNSTMDVALAAAGSVTGKTDKDGNYHFDLQLPSYLTGRPLNNGMAPVVVEATVKDSSGHAETRGEPITVSQSAMLLTAAPEGGQLIPGLENQVFVLASYPDGSPAEANLKVRIAGVPDQEVETDKGGVGMVRVTPRGENVELAIDASDAHGNHASEAVQLQSRNGADQVLLRTNRSIYKVGDRLDLTVLSTTPGGSVYIDLIKDGQTILTRDVDIVEGEASLAIDATPDMAGTLEIHTYRFGQDAQAIGDHRLVFVQPAGELRIETVADAPEYRPGSEARIRFRVTDGHGDAVHAALGLQVVDEAVFALAEKQPGFAKVFFYLEQELMKPRFEIHSLSMDDVVGPCCDEKSEVRDRDAHALFAAMEMTNPNKLETEFGRTLPQSKVGEFVDRYRQAFLDRVRKITAKLSTDSGNLRNGDLVKIFEELGRTSPFALEDAWGTRLRVEPTPWSRGTTKYYTVRSAGADRDFNTGDDMEATIEARTGALLGGANRSTVSVKIEHNRGALNGRAEITGTVIDVTGAVIAGSIVTLNSLSTKDHRTAIAGKKGEFTFGGLAPGTYRVQITSPGFQVGARRLTVGPQDRAVLDAKLNVGAMTEAVDVATGGPVWRFAINPVTVPAPMALAVMNGPGLGPGYGGGFGGGLMGSAGGALKADTHVRSYFPEALYINPEIVTDGNGEASIEIPIADSITTWRMAMLASTVDGALGTSTSSLKVFQNFFVDLDLPVTLTQGDRVSIPVAIYNYAGRSMVFAVRGFRNKEPHRGIRTGGRIAIHAGSQAHR
jgi:Alpha-2-macroglobulin family/Carboxypeptidase regulatory-like domain/MG2 domain/Alpha-2-macroglobulin bait region domain/Macroglobulin domain MG3